jgi:hypothetical protein
MVNEEENAMFDAPFWEEKSKESVLWSYMLRGLRDRMVSPFFTIKTSGR